MFDTNRFAKFFHRSLLNRCECAPIQKTCLLVKFSSRWLTLITKYSILRTTQSLNCCFRNEADFLFGKDKHSLQTANLNMSVS